MNTEQATKNIFTYTPGGIMYHKGQSYDIWFLRYEVQQKELFCDLGLFSAVWKVATNVDITLFEGLI